MVAKASLVREFFWGGVALLVAIPFAHGCANDADDCAVTQSCVAPSAGTAGTKSSGGLGGADAAGGSAGHDAGESGNSGGGSAGGLGAAGDAGAGGAGVGCDPSDAPSAGECAIHEDLAVFVAPDGSDDDGDGSRAAPFGTLGFAIARAIETGRRVYACADGGEYEDTIALDDSANGLAIYGGFSCGDWTYTGTKSVVAPDAALALRVSGVERLHIEDMTFIAPDGLSPGESSVAALVTSSTDVVFRRVRLDAGKGADGAAAELLAFDFPSASELEGDAANTLLGGETTICECPGEMLTTGGEGGDAAGAGESGGDGLPDFGGGTGGPQGTCDVGAQRGGDAPESSVAAGAKDVGELTASGWTPRAGSAGAIGQPGQGGGGGASNASGGGGAGGCGSCGGAGGPGGLGGGASIALAVFESSVTVEGCELVTSDAGDGGAGATGQPGQTDAGRGGNGSAGSCSGGEGGLGAAGGTGGGGAGGIVVALLFRGATAPAIDANTSIALGSPGAGGPGGIAGENDGIAGIAAAVRETP
jgi:hypothetical protein